MSYYFKDGIVDLAQLLGTNNPDLIVDTITNNPITYAELFIKKHQAKQYRSIYEICLSNGMDVLDWAYKANPSLSVCKMIAHLIAEENKISSTRNGRDYLTIHPHTKYKVGKLVAIEFYNGNPMPLEKAYSLSGKLLDTENTIDYRSRTDDKCIELYNQYFDEYLDFVEKKETVASSKISRLNPFKRHRQQKVHKGVFPFDIKL